MRSMLSVTSIMMMWTIDSLHCRRFAMAFQSTTVPSRTIARIRYNYLSLEAASTTTTTNTAAASSGSKSSSSSPSLPRVLLKRNRQSKAFRDGSQLVFTKSISKTIGNVQMGSLVQVEVPASADTENTQTQTVGWGVYNPISMYRVRILCHARQSSLALQLQNWKTDSGDGTSGDCDDTESSLSLQEEMLSAVLKNKFQKALHIRQAMGWPSSRTDTYRLVNGEGDELSGLAVDVIGGKVAVVMSSCAWAQIYQSLIMKILQEILPNHNIVWKTTPSRLRQDGYEMDIDDVDKEDNFDGKIDYDEDQPVIGMENGVKYQTFPYRRKGQKTSVYCDQRDNRFDLAQLCHGKKVLDLCCYHGGFALNAVLNGQAAHVIGVDSSQDAIDTCYSNAKLNQLDETDQVAFVQNDISNYMQSCQETFDVIILDPPKLAPSVKDLARASRKYHSLNRDALKLMADEGGHFMTCTCSAAMTQKEGGTAFLQMVQQASLAARRDITLLRVSGAASCHTQAPVSFPAGNYLTVALFHVHPK